MGTSPQYLINILNSIIYTLILLATLIGRLQSSGLLSI